MILVMIFSKESPGEGNQEECSPKPEKFAKDGKQPASMPAVSFDSKINLKVLLIFKFY